MENSHQYAKGQKLLLSVCNNNILCYTTIEQEKDVEVPEQNYKPIQMLEKTDLHNKTISAIASAEARKRAYEHNLAEIQNFRGRL